MRSRKEGLVLGVALTCVVSATATMAATEEQKRKAIQDGLASLYSTQQPNGSWDYGVYDPAATGAAVLAFVSQNDKWESNEAAYQAAVDSAVSYLLAIATKITVSTRNDGVNICPGGSGSCPGIFWNLISNERQLSESNAAVVV